jgi:hypothetical protein
VRSIVTREMTVVDQQDDTMARGHRRGGVDLPVVDLTFAIQ